MVGLALFAALGLHNQAAPRDTDVWFCPYIQVTGHTPFDQTPGPNCYDARDMFGGTFGTARGEQGHVVFEDNSGGPGFRDFVEWNTVSPVVINRLIFSWQDDSPGNNWRNLSQFQIMARRTDGENWRVLWQENTPTQVGRHTNEKRIAPEQFQFFRAEFVRSGSADFAQVGPRICALEAYGHAVRQ